MKKSHLMIRIDEEVKKEFVQKVENETGLNASQWVRMKIIEFLQERRYNMTGDKFHDRLVELAEKMDYSEYHIQGGELYLLDENGEVVHTEEMPD